MSPPAARAIAIPNDPTHDVLGALPVVVRRAVLRVWGDCWWGYPEFAKRDDDYVLVSGPFHADEKQQLRAADFRQVRNLRPYERSEKVWRWDRPGGTKKKK